MSAYPCVGILVLVALVWGQASAQARSFRLWSYQELVDASDVVALVEPIATKPDSNVKWTDPYWADDVQGVATTFRVLVVFKGKLKEEPLLFRHFIPKPNNHMVANAPSFMHFENESELKVPPAPKGTSSYGPGTPPKPLRWLAFLKQCADGSFEPVSGQGDSWLSFRLVNEASPVF